MMTEQINLPFVTGNEPFFANEIKKIVSAHINFSRILIINDNGIDYNCIDNVLPKRNNYVVFYLSGGWKKLGNKLDYISRIHEGNKLTLGEQIREDMLFVNHAEVAPEQSTFFVGCIRQ